MNRQDFLNKIHDKEFTTKLADLLFPEMPLFPDMDVEVVIEKKPEIKDYIPRSPWVRLSNIAIHYGQDLDKIKVIIKEELAFPVVLDPTGNAHGYCISKEDTFEVVKHFKRKYNNFNK